MKHLTEENLIKTYRNDGGVKIKKWEYNGNEKNLEIYDISVRFRGDEERRYSVKKQLYWNIPKGLTIAEQVGQYWTLRKGLRIAYDLKDNYL